MSCSAVESDDARWGPRSGLAARAPAGRKTGTPLRPLGPVFRQDFTVKGGIDGYDRDVESERTPGSALNTTACGEGEKTEDSLGRHRNKKHQRKTRGQLVATGQRWYKDRGVRKSDRAANAR